MAAAKTVSYQENADGTHSLGVKLDGVFVPFVTLEPHYVADRIAAGKSPEAKAANDNTDEGDN